MDRLLSVSRAAKLAGVSRSELQKKIQGGDLVSFEGKLRLEDVTAVFPQARIEDTAMVEKIEAIVENALKRARGIKLQKLLTPDLGTLAARVYVLSKELVRSRTEQNRLKTLRQETLERLQAIQLTNASDTAVSSLLQWLEDSIAAPVTEDINEKTSLLVKDTFLRLLAAQVHIMPSGHEFLIEGNNSILEAGLNAGLTLNYGCSNGQCGNCKARLISGEVRLTREHEYVLSENEVKRGFILACSNTAVTDVVLLAQEAIDETDIPIQEIDAHVSKQELINEQWMILTLRTPLPSRLRFLSGQSVYLSMPGIDETLYPVASCPCDERNLQFHIPRSDTPFSHYVFNLLSHGERVGVRGPQGTFLLETDNGRPLIFITTDNGFAYIKVLIEQAITLGEVDRIHLYRFNSEGKRPYLDNLCRAWNDSIDTFHYTLCPSTPVTGNDNPIESLFSPLASDYPDMQEFNIYLAGENELLEQATLFLDRQDHPQAQRFSRKL